MLYKLLLLLKFEWLLGFLTFYDILNGLFDGSNASCFLVYLNFYLVALKISIFLSYFDVSSFCPFGCSSNTTYFPTFSIVCTVTPLKY